MGRTSRHDAGGERVWVSTVDASSRRHEQQQTSAPVRGGARGAATAGDDAVLTGGAAVCRRDLGCEMVAEDIVSDKEMMSHLCSLFASLGKHLSRW